MTYLVLVVALVGPATVLLLVARARGRGPVLSVVAWTALVLAVLTVVFDSLMIAAELFTYGEEHLVGLRLWRAPVEDLGYPLLTALLLPTLWHLLERRGARSAARTQARP